MKVAIVGAGNVGGSLALGIALRGLADVTLLDVVEGLAAGKALDIAEASPILGFNVRVEGSSEPASLDGSDIVVITAGKPRTPGMSRDELALTNARTVKVVAAEVAKYAPGAILIVVTNPLDVMSYLAWKVTGFPSPRVLGMGGTLDGSRFRYFIADELSVPVEQVSTLVLGGHGDLMVPLVSYTTVAGVPVSQLLAEERLAELVERTRKAGGEIVSLLKTGSAYVAPAAGVLELVQAIIRDEKRIAAVSVLGGSAYGLSDVYVGLPARIGKSGVEQVVELELEPRELEALKDSAAQVREMIEATLPLI